MKTSEKEDEGYEIILAAISAYQIGYKAGIVDTIKFKGKIEGVIE